MYVYLILDIYLIPIPDKDITRGKNNNNNNNTTDQYLL